MIANKIQFCDSKGFSLVELLITILFAGVLMGLAVPSLIAMDKPLKKSVQKFSAQLVLIRNKALSSGVAYRFKPKYSRVSDYSTGFANQFIVESADTCFASNWRLRPEFEIKLDNVGITNKPNLNLGTMIASSNNLDWNLCFDGQGFVNNPVPIILEDYKKNNRGMFALFTLARTGTYRLSIFDKNYRQSLESNTSRPIF